ncbi:MAG: hypothetical protein ABIJ92_03530 [Candidatus Aenigmatarchaeota archaeon]
MRRGISLVSAVIFLAFTVVAVGIIYESAIPIIARMQSAAIIEEMKTTFVELDKIVTEVASEGRGSKRTIFLDIDQGTFYVNDSQDIIYWFYETSAFVFSPRTSQTFGNLMMGSNLDTTASESTFLSTDAYILENEHLVVYINKTGTPSNFTDYRTSDLLLGVYQKDLGKYLNLTTLNITIDDQVNSGVGNGYTTLVVSGSNLPYATVTALMNSSYLAYFINFTLESGTDFLEIEVTS